MKLLSFFSGCYFQIEKIKIGNRYGIFCESGCLIIPTEKEIKEYNFKECRI